MGYRFDREPTDKEELVELDRALQVCVNCGKPSVFVNHRHEGLCEKHYKINECKKLGARTGW